MHFTTCAGACAHWFWLVPLFFFVFMAILATGCLARARRRRFGCCGFGAGPEYRERGGTPREVLDHRFARGDLSKEEYEEMKRRLDPD